MPEVWAFVERVERDRWFRRHFGSRRFRVDDGRGRRHGGARGYAWITLPKFARYPQYILHEVAHCVTPSDVASHGWQYAANYLLLVRHFLGAEAHDELRAAFKKHRVRFRAPRQLSATAREAAALRLAAYRARSTPNRMLDIALARANAA